MSLIILNAAQLVCVSQTGAHSKRGPDLRNPAVLAGGALLIRDGRIAWLGPTADLPPLPAGARILDAAGKTVLPGFVDSHTHLLFAGARADEFEQRLQGATYQEIAARGGGINATVQRVRAASKDELK